jgi:hypothetical protein
MGAKWMMVERYHSDPDFKQAGTANGVAARRTFIIGLHQMLRCRLTRG